MRLNDVLCSIDDGGGGDGDADPAAVAAISGVGDAVEVSSLSTGAHQLGKVRLRLFGRQPR